MATIRVIGKFRSFLSGHQKLRIIELAALMIIGGILETCSVSLILPFMDAVMNPELSMEKWYAKIICSFFNIESPRIYLAVVAIVLAIIYLVKNAYLLAEYNIQYRFVYGNMLAMQQRLLDNIIHRPYEFFLSANSGGIVQLVHGDTPNTFVLLSTLLSLFTELIVSGMLIIAVFYIAPAITIAIAVVLLLLLIGINLFIKPTLQKAGNSFREAGAEMNKWLLQSIQGIKEIKVNGCEKYFRNKYDLFGIKYVDALRKNQILSICPRFIIEAVSMVLLFSVVAVLICKGKSLEEVVPILSAIAMAAIRLLPSVNRISTAIASVSYNEPMLDKLIENLKEINKNIEEDNYICNSDIISERTGSIQSLKKCIQFREITFHYSGSEVNVIDNTSMTIKRGESIGIVGASGAGKTTVIDIILGLLVPCKGQILVDDYDINQDISSWHEMVGYIPQTIFMLDDSIRNNIAFGMVEDAISEEEIWKALEEASLSDFVKELPEGLNTQIGERGMRLSGGQRQRIGIARALYRNPEILIFDEATSALDNTTETAIMDSINSLKGKKTMIIIAHRMSTIEFCDRVFKVENGKITGGDI